MNDQTEMIERSADQPAAREDVVASARFPQIGEDRTIAPQAGGRTCGCGGNTVSVASGSG